MKDGDIFRWRYKDEKHSNSSRDNFYIRKGAQRSRDKMRDVVAERIAETEREISYRQSRLERLHKVALDLESGKDLNEVHL